MVRDIQNMASTTERLSQAQKDAHGKQWYKDKANSYDIQSSDNQYFGFGEVSEYKRKKVKDRKSVV